MSRARYAYALALLAFAACTPGGAAMTGSGGSGANVTTIDVNLTLSQPVGTPYGLSGGMTPPVTTVAVGSVIQFMNTDGFAHTATLIPPSDKTFPAGSPFGISATTPSGNAISDANWSSGAMQGGARSQPITVDKPGTYLFGCFFHYGAPMRGAIVAQ
jgi:plastocyanin